LDAPGLVERIRRSPETAVAAQLKARLKSIEPDMNLNRFPSDNHSGWSTPSRYLLAGKWTERARQFHKPPMTFCSRRDSSRTVAKQKRWRQGGDSRRLGTRFRLVLTEGQVCSGANSKRPHRVGRGVETMSTWEPYVLFCRSPPAKPRPYSDNSKAPRLGLPTAGKVGCLERKTCPTPALRRRESPAAPSPRGALGRHPGWKPTAPSG
jgi:hypothetical protein